MKPAGFHLLIFVVTGPLAAQEPTESATDRKISARLTQEIRVALPKFTPPPPPVLDQPKNDGTEDDPDVLALPKFTVKEKRAQRIEPSDLLTSKELSKKFKADYKKSLTGLDAALNSFVIPIVSAPISLRDPSPLAARGRELYRARRIEDLNRTIEAGKLGDKENSAALKNEVTEMHRAQDWQNRVTGGK
jgi:hypothetical protein